MKQNNYYRGYVSSRPINKYNSTITLKSKNKSYAKSKSINYKLSITEYKGVFGT